MRLLASRAPLLSSMLLAGLSLCSLPTPHSANLVAQEAPVLTETTIQRQGLPNLLGPLSPLRSNQTIRRAINSTVRIHKEEGRQSWYGSGTVIGEYGGNWVILSNCHVLGDPGSRAKVEFFKDGVSLGWFWATVDKSILKNSIDIAVATVPRAGKLQDVDFTPLAHDGLLAEKAKLITIGCDAGHWPNLQLGHAVRSSESLLYYLPTSHPGDSGSAVFSEDGSRVVALTAWMTRVDGTLHGLAMPVSAVRNALLSGEVGQELPQFCYSTRTRSTADVPNVGPQDLLDLFRDKDKPNLPGPPDEDDLDQPPLPSPDRVVGPIRQLFEGLQEFLVGRFDDQDRSFLERIQESEERALDRDQDIQDELEAYGIETRGFLSEFRKSRQEYLLQLESLRKEQRELEEEQRGLLDSLGSRFSYMVSMFNLIWYIVVGLAVLAGIGVFAGQGWAMSLLVWLFRAISIFLGAIVRGAVAAFNSPKPQYQESQIDTAAERLALLAKAAKDAGFELTKKDPESDG